MKKIFVFFAAILAVLGLNFTVLAYNPTLEDKQVVQKVENQLDKLTKSNEKLFSFYVQVKKFKLDYKLSDRIKWMIDELESFLKNKIEQRKISAKKASLITKAKIYKKYYSGIVLDKDLPENCYKYFELLDDMGYLLDFPTSVIIATWYRETSCRMYLPGNGDGPFQIVSKDYGTGELKESDFYDMVLDFVNFSKNKYDWYNRVNSNSGLKVDLSYTHLSFSGLLRHAALYNGLSGAKIRGEIYPASEKYFWEGYTGFVTGSVRLGFFPAILKLIDYEFSLIESGNFID